MKNYRFNKLAQSSLMEKKLSSLDDEIREIAFSHGENNSSFREDVRLAAKCFNEGDFFKVRNHIFDFYHALHDIANLLESKKELIDLRSKLANSRKLSIEKRAGFFSAIKDLFKKKKTETESISAPAIKDPFKFEDVYSEDISHIKDRIRSIVIAADNTMREVERILNESFINLSSNDLNNYLKNIYKIIPEHTKFEMLLTDANKEAFSVLHKLKHSKDFGEFAHLMHQQSKIKEQQKPPVYKAQYTGSYKPTHQQSFEIGIPLDSYQPQQYNKHQTCPCGSRRAFEACHGADIDLIKHYLINKMSLTKSEADKEAIDHSSPLRESALTSIFTSLQNKARAEERKKEKERRARLTEEERDNEDLLEDIDLNWLKD